MITAFERSAVMRLLAYALPLLLSGCGDDSPSVASNAKGAVTAAAHLQGVGGLYAIPVAGGADPLMQNLNIPVDAASRGMWSSVQDWGLNGLHLSALPTGQILSYGTSSADPATQDGRTLDIWDPTGGFGAHYSMPNVQYVNSFCSAAQLLNNGSLLISGGFAGGAVPWASGQSSTVFDPGLFRANRLNTDMAASRWYGTMIALNDGRQLMVGGGAADQNDNYFLVNAYANASDAATLAHISTTPEVYLPGGGWTSLFGANSTVAYGAEANRAWYPRAWQAPNGRVFGLSTDKMWWMDTANGGNVTIIGSFKTPPSPNAIVPPNTGPTSTAAMYDVGKILQVGGNGFKNEEPYYPSSRAATIIDINSDPPLVYDTDSMTYPRQWAQATVLPDGRVLVTGGSSLGDSDGVAAVQAAELWNPAIGKWAVGASAGVYRGYHSAAVLLPDGAILTTGGGAPGPVTNRNAEIYYPPYLFTMVNGRSALAPRPAILSMSSKASNFGGQLQVEMADASPVGSVVLMGLGSVTHSFDMGQRRIPVTFMQNGNLLTVTMPPSGNIAPSGYYQLVVLNTRGTPSRGAIIGLNAATPPAASSLPTATIPVVPNNVPTQQASASALQPVAYPNYRVRHIAFLGYVSPINGLTPDDGISPILDSSFVVREGLADRRCYSFEAKGFPGFFLRHANFRVQLNANDGSDIFSKDATFCAQRGLAGSGVSLMPVAFPGYYLRHGNFELWIAPNDGSAGFQQDATFNVVDPAEVSLQPVAYPGYQIGHANFLGYILPVSGTSAAADKLNTSFSARAGLSGRCTSFESKSFPGYYLRHQNFRVMLSRSDGTDGFRQDASWCVRPGLSGSGVSFEASNWPGFFMRHRNFELWLDQYGAFGAASYDADASFVPVGNL